MGRGLPQLKKTLSLFLQETTVEMVNHLRVMIEEAEFHSSNAKSDKLFVVLLHFPPAMFFDSCYPALFLRGWRHFYLDSIGQSLDLGLQLDIEEWLQRCCFPDKSKKLRYFRFAILIIILLLLSLEFEKDNLIEVCENFLEEVLPALISCCTFGAASKTPEMKTAERLALLTSLLMKKGVGLKLCSMFRSCWTLPMMMECLEKAAKFTQTRESSLNMTDTVHTIFQSSFTDFMAVMLTKINEDHNIDVLFSSKCKPEIQQLFIALMETVVIPPNLYELKKLAGSVVQSKPRHDQTYSPTFPFFRYTYFCCYV